MKYEGKKLNGQENTVFQFFIGKEELEIMVRLFQRAYENTPKTTDNQIYYNRLKSLCNQFGKVYVEEVKGKILPTKNHWDHHPAIKRQIPELA